MAPAQRICDACSTPLPRWVSYCPVCGSATPTEVTPAPGGPIETGPATWSEPEEVEHRRRLQRALGEGFRLAELIGQGGFGSVYVARDVELERRVAIKCLRHDLFPDSRLVQRFKHEARAVAKLRHPHIVPIYAVGEGEGIAYMIMPLIEGESLRSVLDREGALAIAEARRILMEAGDALAAVHALGIVHRDIKPGNMMLEGVARRVLLMDFGIAKAVRDADAGFTSTGAVIGTPVYMSPEQAAGDSDIDQRSDIYSLGAVGYQMLTGRPPFQGADAREVMLQHLAARPPDLTSLRPRTPYPLARCVERCLEKLPDSRWSSASALVEALREVDVAAEAFDAAPGGDREARPTPTGRPARRWPLFALGALGLATFFVLRPTAFPPPLNDPGMSKADALKQANAFFESQGAVGAFDDAVTLDERIRWRTFLEQTLGLEGARDWVDTVMPLGSWIVRWVDRERGETWGARLARGQILEVRHDSPKLTELDPVSRTEAARLAASFIERLGWTMERLQPLGSLRAPEGDRPVHYFGWQQTGTAIPWRSGSGEQGVASVMIYAAVTGDRATAYSRALELPSDFEQASEVLENLPKAAGIIVAIIGLLALGVLFRRHQVGAVRWKPAFVVGGLVALGSFLELLEGLDTVRFNAAGAELELLRITMWLITGLGAALVFAGLAAVILAYGESEGRSLFPRSLTSYRELVAGRLWSPVVRRSLLDGYALAGIILGYEAVYFALLTRVPGGSGNFAEIEYTSYLSPGFAYLSWLGGLLVLAISASIMVLFFLAFFKRYLKSIVLSIGIIAVLGGLLHLRVQPPLYGMLESGIIAIILSIALIHYGLLTTFVGEAVFLFTISSIGALTSPYLSLQAAGLLTVGTILLLPLVLKLVAHRRQPAGVLAAPGS